MSRNYSLTLDLMPSSKIGELVRILFICCASMGKSELREKRRDAFLQDQGADAELQAAIDEFRSLLDEFERAGYETEISAGQ